MAVGYDNKRLKQVYGLEFAKDYIGEGLCKIAALNSCAFKCNQLYSDAISYY